jgi:hypothetical protein
MTDRSVTIKLSRETEEKTRQPETKLGATYTAQSKATQRKAKLNEKPQKHIWGAKEA